MGGDPAAMSNLDFYLNGHMTLIFFIYGMIFVVLGILAARRRRSAFTFADHLWLLAAFGFLHGLHEWTAIFAIGYSTEKLLLQYLNAANLLLMTASYFFLFLFGLRMVRMHGAPRFLEVLPLASLCGWTLFAVALWRSGADSGDTLFRIETLGRYFLCFPASLLASAGFFMLRRQLVRTGWKKVSFGMLGAGLMFALYGFFAGLVTPGSDMGFSSYFNYSSFFQLLGVPVQVLRALCALFIVIFVGKSLRIFDEERKRLDQEERKERALLQERNRIAMELHDGAQQILFSIGIQAEACMMKKEPDNMIPCLKMIKDLAQRGITDIRSTVLDLGRKEEEMKPLGEIVREVAEGIFASGDVEVSIDFDEKSTYGFEEESILFRFFQEGLLNVHKHAAASKVSLGTKEDQGVLRMWIHDNGRGLPRDARDPEATRRRGKMGLWGMKERLEKKGGALLLEAPPSGGTRIEGTLKIERQ